MTDRQTEVCREKRGDGENIHTEGETETQEEGGVGERRGRDRGGDRQRHRQNWERETWREARDGDRERRDTPRDTEREDMPGRAGGETEPEGDRAACRRGGSSAEPPAHRAPRSPADGRSGAGPSGWRKSACCSQQSVKARAVLGSPPPTLRRYRAGILDQTLRQVPRKKAPPSVCA